MPSVYEAVAARAVHRCEYCHAPEAIFTLRFEVDHIVPVSLGGVDALENLALACRACNLWKSNITTGWDTLTGQRVPLFNPRRDRWDEHFAVVGADNDRIVGHSPSGRATIDQLRMNAASQCEARRWWTKIDLFP